MAEQTAPIPPHNLDAEESILGAMLLSPRAIDAVADIVDAADFYRASHARIYRAALTMHQQGAPVDAITVADRLAELGQLDEIGGKERVHEIASLVPAASNAGHYARIVVRLARLRRVFVEAETIARASFEPTADIDELEQQLRALADTLDQRPAAAAPTIAALTDFITTEEEHTEPLAGENGETLLPAGGLLILGGEGGASKTTLTLDAVAHLASGTPWLGYPVGRPLRILIIENEGPRPQFREKLRSKADTWRGAPWQHNVHVWEHPWASFSFARDTDRRQLRQATLEHQIDLVVADPLDSLGVLGAGTPEDTRTFISWLRACGLHNPTEPVAYWLLHHFNKTGRGSVTQQLSGAWGGHPDAIIGVELGDGQTTKLTWGKLRHATPPAQRTTVLRWDIDARGFHPIDKPDQVDADTVRAAILQHVAEHPGLSRGKVEDALHAAFKNRDNAVSRKQLRDTIDRLIDVDRALRSQPGPNARGTYLHITDPSAGRPANDPGTTPPQDEIPFAASTANASPDLAQTADSPFADDLFGERGEQNYTDDSLIRRGPGETDHLQNGSTTGSEAHSPSAALPEGEAVGERRTTFDHPAAANGTHDDDDRWAALLASGEPEHEDQQHVLTISDDDFGGEDT